MNFSKIIYLTLLLCTLWSTDCIAVFTRHPNLSPYTYYKVTFSSQTYQEMNGIYVKDTARGIQKDNACGFLNCTGDCYWNGTWVYKYKFSQSTTYYLFEFYNNNKYQAVIAKASCQTSDWTVISQSMKVNVGLGRGQNFSEATSVLWSSQSSGFVISVSICYSGQSGCNSPSPTRLPTKYPVKPPTQLPTTPTRSPTPPTRKPTTAPTTPRPTNLPTKPTTIYNSTYCSYLRVTGLTAIFQGTQTDYRFKALPMSSYMSEGRRMWSNGHGVQIYFSKRWYPSVGVWVISNGSLTLIKNRTSTTDDAPGTNSGAYGLWDHFVNNNVYEPIQSRVTLSLRCLLVSTSWPTPLPTKAPVKPTKLPTRSPTTRPTSACTLLQVHHVSTTCPTGLAGKLGGFYSKQTKKFNNKLYFTGIASAKGSTLFWSDLFKSWIIDSNSWGYSAVSPSDITSQFPPNMTTWSIFDQDDSFNLDCDVVIRLICLASTLPTSPPTRAPISSAPTAHTNSPTSHPTRRPTKYPSYSPSSAPTFSPTSAPVEGCDGITVAGTQDSLSQRYQIGRNSMIANRNYWKAVHGDAEIFYSSSILHQSWVINSESLGIYWLAQRIPKTQPPLKSLWDMYIKSSPFVIKSLNLTLTCNRDWYPTPHPTYSPTRAPTRNPTKSPSKSPTKPPTRHPTQAPTSAPTRSPSRHPTAFPTRHPTSAPSAAPTKSPTRRICDYITLDAPPEYAGIYQLESDYIGKRHGLWTKVDDPEKNITYVNESWVLRNSHFGKENLSYVVSSTDWKPPDQAYWYRQFIGSTDKVWITTDCDLTKHPTSSPTRHPTMAPTRSHCNGMEISNLTALLPGVSLNIVGWYRKQSYSVNGKWWWINEQNTEAVKFFDGLWYVLPIDNPQIDTETTINRILTNISRFDDRPPFLAKWIYPHNPQFSVQLSIICHGTRHPSQSPTRMPTISPTPNIPPQWTYCPKRPYFAFATNQTKIPVYWNVPIAKDDQNFSINLWQRVSNGTGFSTKLELANMTEIQPGTSLVTGNHYEYLYMATDAMGEVNNCTVSIYVLKAAPYNSFDYCVKHAFSIDILVNQDHYIVGDKTKNQYEIDNGIVIGKVNLPSLTLKKQNCYVRGQLVAQVSNKAASPATSTYLGIKGTTMMWQIIILVIIVCVLGLTAHAIREFWKRYCGKCTKADQKSLVRDVDGNTEDKEIMMVDVGPESMARKEPLLNAENTTSINASQRKPSEGTGPSSGEEAAIKLASKQSMINTNETAEEEKRYEPPTLSPVNMVTALPKVPDTEEFWSEALDDLNIKGFRNRPKNLELLIRYALRSSDGTIDKTATANKVADLLKKLMAKKKLDQQQQQQVQKANRPLKQNQPPPPPGPPPLDLIQPGSTFGNDAVLNMLERDAGIDKKEGDPEPPPPVISEDMEPPNPVPPPPGRPDIAYYDERNRETNGY